MTQQEFERYADVAQGVARRFAAKGANVDYDDLFQDACVALLEQEFDRDRTDGQIRGYLTKRVYFRMLDRFRAATRWRQKSPAPRFVHVSNVDEELLAKAKTRPFSTRHRFAFGATPFGANRSRRGSLPPSKKRSKKRRKPFVYVI